MTDQFEKTVIINSDPATVWKTLTEPALMKKWMGEPEMEINIHTDWTVNSPFIITGFHHVKFTSKGTVLQFDENSALTYSHFSSVSRLADIPDNYSIIAFTLKPLEDQTALTVKITGFPTETIFKHLQFYWQTTIEIIKRSIEKVV